jgi:hypothetical protein
MSFATQHALTLAAFVMCVPQGYVGKNFRNISIKVSGSCLFMMQPASTAEL